MDLGPRKSASEPAEARPLVRRGRHRARGSARIDHRARDEERLVTVGQDSEGRFIVVAWIPLGRGGRIISARRATPRERRNYEENP